MRDGPSARAQTTAESTDTSPDCTPWVIVGRSAAKLRAGRAMPETAVRVAADAPVASKRRRFTAERIENLMSASLTLKRGLTSDGRRVDDCVHQIPAKRRN